MVPCRRVGYLNWPLNASRGLSAIAEFLVIMGQHTDSADISVRLFVRCWLYWLSRLLAQHSATSYCTCSAVIWCMRIILTPFIKKSALKSRPTVVDMVYIMKFLFMFVQVGLLEMKTDASHLCIQLNTTTPARHMEYLYIYRSFCKD